MRSSTQAFRYYTCMMQVNFGGVRSFSKIPDGDQTGASVLAAITRRFELIQQQ